MTKRVRATCQSFTLVKRDSDEDVEQTELYGEMRVHRVLKDTVPPPGVILETRLFWGRGSDSDDWQGVKEGVKYFVNTSHDMIIRPGEVLWLDADLHEYDPSPVVDMRDHFGYDHEEISYQDVGTRTFTLDILGAGGHVQVEYLMTLI